MNTSGKISSVYAGSGFGLWPPTRNCKNIRGFPLENHFADMGTQQAAVDKVGKAMMTS